MAAPQGNSGGSPFAKYTGEQVNQIPAGYVEGMGSMGKAYAQIGQTIGNAMVGMAQEYQKQDLQKAQAQGLLDSYTGGDVESAMYRDDTPTHVKSFLDRSLASGGVDKMSQRDINAFLAGEQAYGTQLDRRLKERQVATAETKANADAVEAQDPLKKFGKIAEVGTKLNEALSPAVRADVVSVTPSTTDIFRTQLAQSSVAASNKVRQEAQPKVDALRDAYNVARQELNRTQTTPIDLNTVNDIEGYQQAYEAVETNIQNAKSEATTALMALQSQEQETAKVASFAGLEALKAGYQSPQALENAKVARREAILGGIRMKKASLAEEASAKLGPAVVPFFNLTKEDEEFAAKMAAEIPDGTVINSGEGYAWVYEGGKAVFKTAKQMGVGSSEGVRLPENVKLDYGKPFAGMTQEQFHALDAKTQAFISTETGKYADLLKKSLETEVLAGEKASKTLVPAKFFGWSGYVANGTELRYIVNLTTARKSIDYSIDQVIKAYQEYGIKRAYSAEARAVFNATRPIMIASVRPMVAGGNQQSDTELRTILASLPAGEAITSLKEYDIAQYRFMKIMFAKNYENHMSSVPGIKKEGTGMPTDYSGLPSRTRDLIDSYFTGTGDFSGIDGLQRLTLLQTKLKAGADSGQPYLDSGRSPILINTINRAAFDADSANGYLTTLQNSLRPDEVEAARNDPRYKNLETAIAPQ
jgi:hypothetical protein